MSDTCYVCDKPLDSAREEIVNHRTGTVWSKHIDCRDEPVPDSYAATARMMAEICPVEDDPDFWDRWKDDMKERDL